MALRSPSPSRFSNKKRSTSSLTDARSLLTFVSEADKNRRHQNKIASSAASLAPSTTSTPALSFSSSLTADSDSLVEEYDFDDMMHDPNDESGLTRPSAPPTSNQVFNTRHVEFGHCANPAYRHTSSHTPGQEFKAHEEQEPPYYVLLFTYISYLMLIIVGHMRDFFGKRFRAASYVHLMASKVSFPFLNHFFLVRFLTFFFPNFLGLCGTQLGFRFVLHASVEASYGRYVFTTCH